MKTTLLKNKNGFTAIELLFVLLFIGILIFISVSFLNTSRTKTRDAKRLVDVRRIQTALEFYFLEYSTYPAFDQPVILGEESFVQLCDEGVGALVSVSTACESVFMAPIPKDPGSGNYYYLGNAEGYTIQFVTEDTTEIGVAGRYYAHTENIDKDQTLK